MASDKISTRTTTNSLDATGYKLPGTTLYHANAI